MRASKLFSFLTLLPVALFSVGCASMLTPQVESAGDAEVNAELAPPLDAPAGFVVEGLSPAVWHAMKAEERDEWLAGAVKQAHTYISRSTCGDLWRAQQACSSEVAGTYHLTEPGVFRVVLSCANTRSHDVYWFVRGDQMRGPDASAKPEPVCNDGNMAVYYGHRSAFARNETPPTAPL